MRLPVTTAVPRYSVMVERGQILVSRAPAAEPVSSS
jgi:hypothetical protein